MLCIVTMFWTIQLLSMPLGLLFDEFSQRVKAMADRDEEEKKIVVAEEMLRAVIRLQAVVRGRKIRRSHTVLPPIAKGF